MTGGVLQVTVRGVPLDVLCDMLLVFEPVEQLVCLDIRDPQEVSLAMVSTTTILSLDISATCSHDLTHCMHLLGPLNKGV